NWPHDELSSALWTSSFWLKIVSPTRCVIRTAGAGLPLLSGPRSTVLAGSVTSAWAAIVGNPIASAPPQITPATTVPIRPFDIFLIRYHPCLNDGDAATHCVVVFA